MEARAIAAIAWDLFEVPHTRTVRRMKNENPANHSGPLLYQRLRKDDSENVPLRAWTKKHGQRSHAHSHHRYVGHASPGPQILWPTTAAPSFMTSDGLRKSTHNPWRACSVLTREKCQRFLTDSVDLLMFDAMYVTYFTLDTHFQSPCPQWPWSVALWRKQPLHANTANS